MKTEIEYTDFLYTDADQTIAGAALTALALGRVLGFIPLGSTDYTGALHEFAINEMYPPDVTPHIRRVAVRPTEQSPDVYLLDQERFAVERKLLRLHREKLFHNISLHCNLTAIPGAKDGLIYLQEACRLNYQGILSARYNSPELVSATAGWLKKKKFDKPDLVKHTSAMEKKINVLIDDFLTSKNPRLMILIDDYPTVLCEYIQKLFLKNNIRPDMVEALRHIVLVAYGHSDNDLQQEQALLSVTGAQVLSLPNWREQEVIKLSEKIQKLQLVYQPAK